MTFKVWNRGLRDLDVRVESRYGRERVECEFDDIGVK